jgi:hypothetical protein
VRVAKWAILLEEFNWTKEEHGARGRAKSKSVAHGHSGRRGRTTDCCTAKEGVVARRQSAVDPGQHRTA